MGLRTRVTRITLSTVSSLGILLSPFPEWQNVLHIFTAPGSFLLRRLQLIKCIEGCLNYIQDISATLRLGQNIAYTGYFEYSAYATGSNNPCSRRSRFEHYSGTSDLAQNFMRDCGTSEVDDVHLFTGTLGSLAHCIWYGIRLSDTHRN